MKHRLEIWMGSRARVLAAALVLGAVVLSVAPGGTAHAARQSAVVAGDTGTEIGNPHGGPAAKPNGNGGGGKTCKWKNPDGTEDTYQPGETVKDAGQGIKWKCGKDGKWHQVRVSDDASVNQAPGGGVYAPVP